MHSRVNELRFYRYRQPATFRRYSDLLTTITPESSVLQSRVRLFRKKSPAPRRDIVHPFVAGNKIERRT